MTWSRAPNAATRKANGKCKNYVGDKLTSERSQNHGTDSEPRRKGTGGQGDQRRGPRKQKATDDKATRRRNKWTAATPPACGQLEFTNHQPASKTLGQNSTNRRQTRSAGRELTVRKPLMNISTERVGGRQGPWIRPRSKHSGGQHKLPITKEAPLRLGPKNS